MRFPVRAAKACGHRALYAGEAKNCLGVMRSISVPEAPEILECCVSLAIEESMLQAVGFVAGETVRHIDRVAGLQPFVLANHGNKRIRLAFPRDPIIPADVGPLQRLVARLKLWLQRERKSDVVGGLAELRWNCLQRIEVDAVSIDLLHQLRDNGPIRRAFWAGSGVPRQKRKKNLHTVFMELLDHLTQAGNSAWQVAQ